MYKHVTAAYQILSVKRIAMYITRMGSIALATISWLHSGQPLIAIIWDTRHTARYSAMCITIVLTFISLVVGCLLVRDINRNIVTHPGHRQLPLDTITACCVGSGRVDTFEVVYVA